MKTSDLCPRRAGLTGHCVGGVTPLNRWVARALYNTPATQSIHKTNKQPESDPMAPIKPLAVALCAAALLCIAVGPSAGVLLCKDQQIALTLGNQLGGCQTATLNQVSRRRARRPHPAAPPSDAGPRPVLGSRARGDPRPCEGIRPPVPAVPAAPRHHFTRRKPNPTHEQSVRRPPRPRRPRAARRAARARSAPLPRTPDTPAAPPTLAPRPPNPSPLQRVATPHCNPRAAPQFASPRAATGTSRTAPTNRRGRVTRCRVGGFRAATHAPAHAARAAPAPTNACCAAGSPRAPRAGAARLIPAGRHCARGPGSPRPLSPLPRWRSMPHALPRTAPLHPSARRGPAHSHSPSLAAAPAQPTGRGCGPRGLLSPPLPRRTPPPAAAPPTLDRGRAAAARPPTIAAPPRLPTQPPSRALAL